MRLFRTIFGLLIFASILAGLGVAYLLWDLPSADTLRHYRPPVASEVFSADYIKIGEFFRQRRIYRPISGTPPTLVKAFVAAEDADFFRHGGVSLSGIFRAMVKNLLAGEVKQGGSTITQQVAKQILLRSRERSFTRKAREALLAFKMEKVLSKEQILEIYLNEVFLGHAAYGVAAAAQVYFDKDASDLTLGESAVLAGLTKAPSTDNPFSNLERAKGRQAYVLKRMLDEKYISPEEQKEALDAGIVISQQKELGLRYAPYFVEHVRRYVTDRYGDDLVLTGGLQIYTTINAAQAHDAQAALRNGIEELDRHQGFRGPEVNLTRAERPAFLQSLTEENHAKPLEEGAIFRALVTHVDDAKGTVSVHLGSRTGTIPFDEMKWARKPNADRYWENDLIQRPSQALREGDVVRARVLPNSAKVAATLPAGTLVLTLSQEPLAQGALIAIEPRTGAVRAMAGGYDFEKSEFNRAVQARRQPGSAFKPIVYASALDHGYTAASMLIDAPIVYDDPTTDVTWRPKNFGGKFYGKMIFRECLIESRNIPSVKIVQDIGIDAVLDYARRFGIESPLARDFSVGLGSSSVTPLELTSAYAVFASGGRKVKPVSVRKVVDRDGKVLERNMLDDPALDLIEQANVLHQRSLADVVTQQAIELGKDPKAKLPEGYVLSPQTAFLMTHLLKQVVHSGTGQRASALNRPTAGKTGTTNDNRDAWFVGYTPKMLAAVWLGFDDSQPLGPMEMGGRAATPVWLEFMEKALKKSPITDFTVPDGVVFIQIDPASGLLATPKTQKPVFEAFREGTEPKETADDVETQKSPQQFFLQE